ncbi:beta-hexosaminidase [Aplysia californica]|uniref:beta-N-acetylhexosaminidase n=1 Tax=Aplysia californica TaxID=6500 RepID=A0ABM0ZVQ5_APLCA|nr:beta-hexosaminidase [Aplysia californica]
MTIPEIEDLKSESIKCCARFWKRLRLTGASACCFRSRKRKRWFVVFLIIVTSFVTMYLNHKLSETKELKVSRMVTRNRNRRKIRVALTQEDLDVFSNTIQLNYTVVENSFFNKKLFQAEIRLTNTGDRAFPKAGWEIFFSQPSLIEPDRFPYPDGVEMPKYGVRFFFIQGHVYRIVPTPLFKGIKPGKFRVIRYISEHSNAARTDVHPNWYFAGGNLEPRTIANTRGNSLDFVSEHDTPATWKRNTLSEKDDYDFFNPFTAGQRYEKDGVEDLGRAASPVLPTPADIQAYDPQRTVNVLTSNWVIVSGPRLANEAGYLSEVWSMRQVVRAPSNFYVSFIDEVVRVSVRGRTLPTDETYELRVDPNTNIIIIRASQPAGAFYAIQTLISLADRQGNVPTTVIRDGPRYRYRGLMLDVARSFYTKENVFRYIDVMAMYKLNKLHLHLTDDEGWRIDIPGLEELTQVGAKRCHDVTETRCLLPFLGTGPYSGPPGSGFYTVEDYRDILRYAKARHIEVIPEIDMPGHGHAAIKAMEARYKRLINLNATEASRFLLSDLQDKSVYQSVQGFTDDAINPCLRSTYTFISRVINLLYAMHRDISPLRVFHFGGDEVPAGTWEKSPVCSRLLQSGITRNLKQYLATQIANMTSLYNLDLAAWEDGLLHDSKPMRRNTLPNRNVYIFAWNNVWEWGVARRAYDFANNGYKVIVTPATNFYFDHPYEPDPEERGLYWATRYTNTKKVFKTMPENLYRNADTYRSGKPITICDKASDCPPLRNPDNIEGVQGSLFGELIRAQGIQDYMMLPRLLALAERAWHAAPWEYVEDHEQQDQAAERDWVRFANTVGHRELARLDRVGFKYRIPPPGAVVTDEVMKVSTAFPGLQVEMSDDNGLTWSVVDPEGETIDPEKDYILRTKAAFGTRYSRVVNLRDNVSSAFTTVASRIMIIIGLAIALSSYQWSLSLL